ncbi:MAG: prepilin-type N-terminal cleavage/methylation domain-containing protein [Actinobacteria bacterium]|nr:prepilin-type N-terminal cleavage/methylation domain-containing protein [Actinomycetota bacterium]
MFRKKIKSEKGLTLIEVIMAMSLLSVVFSLVFSSLFQISRLFNFNSDEIIVHQELVNKTELFLSDIRNSDDASCVSDGLKLVLSSNAKKKLISYKLIKENKENFKLVKYVDGGSQTVLRNLLPPPESQFNIVNRTTGKPLIQIKLTIKDKGVTFSKTAWVFSRGYAS